LEQEDKYIEILVGKILKLKPDVLMVGKSVCRRAQELLFKSKVQLLQHVKPTLLTRISRLTGAAIISSTDHIMNQFGPESLGKCYRFRFIVSRMNEIWVDGEGNESGQYHIKSLLDNPKLAKHERQAALAANMLGENILDGSEAIKSGLSKRGVTQTYVMLEGCPKHLGCTVILRGTNKAALKQVKNVFRFLVSVAYNMRLEISYLKERCARLRPDFKVEKKNLYSSSLCVDYGQPPTNRKIRPWNGGTNSEGMQRSISGQITAFDHQSILITSVWMTEKTQCCPAEVKGICYYSLQDVSLGQFLRDSCFNLSLKCQNPSCKKSVLDHSLSFVHNDGLINITVDHMEDALPSATSETNKAASDSKQNDDDSEDHEDTPIATWTYCKQCSKVVTPLVWLSENTWKYSFGKFLESFFYNRDTIMNSPQSTCKCQLQKSATLFFGCGRLAARFTYERIRPFGVFVRKSLPIDIPFHRAKALNELEKISMSSSLLFVKFDKHIEKVAREARSLPGGSKNENLQTVLSELNRISNEVDHAAKTLQEKIASVSDKCINGSGGSVNIDALFQFPWFARRFLFMLTSAWNEKLNAAGQAIVAMKRLSSQRGEIMGPNAIVGDQNNEELAEGMRRLRQLHEVYSRYNLTDIHTVLPTIVNTDQRTEIDYDDDFEDPDGAIDFAGEVDADVLASRRRLYSTNPVPNTVDLSRSGARALAKRGDQESGSIKQTPGATVKSAISRFFQRGGRERDPYIVELGMFHEGRPRLEPGVNGIVVPVMDEQLSTVIAYSLSSKEYATQFQNFSKLDTFQAETPMSASADQQSPSQQGAPGQSSATVAPGVSNKLGIERRMLMRHKSHIKHTFRDFDEKGQNLCKFVCTTYWATQFQAVREAFLSQSIGSKDSSGELPSTLEVERAYVLSLSSAYSWAASGGKSGASFARTQDDRFVIKCISRTELQMFLDCAPAYFEYLSKAFFHGL
jgi:TCP-1/cpn60 chaperonin family/Phosphatidylinositol-4-phosphate 5-Kinase